MAQKEEMLMMRKKQSKSFFSGFFCCQNQEDIKLQIDRDRMNRASLNLKKSLIPQRSSYQKQDMKMSVLSHNNRVSLHRISNKFNNNDLTQRSQQQNFPKQYNNTFSASHHQRGNSLSYNESEQHKIFNHPQNYHQMQNLPFSINRNSKQDVSGYRNSLNIERPHVNFNHQQSKPLMIKINFQNKQQQNNTWEIKKLAQNIDKKDISNPNQNIFPQEILQKKEPTLSKKKSESPLKKPTKLTRLVSKAQGGHSNIRKSISIREPQDQQDHISVVQQYQGDYFSGLLHTIDQLQRQYHQETLHSMT